MAEDPELTVVIPSWNGRHLLETCLPSLTGQSRACQILVVDNGSTDETPGWLTQQFPQVGCLRLEKNAGFAAAVNQGIRNSRTPYVALLNNDTEADERWIETGLEAFQKYPQYWFFASRMLQTSHPDLLDSSGDCYDRKGLPYKRGNGGPKNRFTTPEPVLGASAGAAFYRKALFDEIGWFDEEYFMYLEDMELSLRAQALGKACFYLPAAIVYHQEAASDPQRRHEPPKKSGGTFYSPNRVFWITRNRWSLMVTYQPFRHCPWLMFGWVKSFLYHALRAGYLGPFIKGVWAGIKGSRSAWIKRQELRERPDFSSQRLWLLIQKCS